MKSLLIFSFIAALFQIPSTADARWEYRTGAIKVMNGYVINSNTRRYGSGWLFAKSMRELRGLENWSADLPRGVYSIKTCVVSDWVTNSKYRAHYRGTLKVATERRHKVRVVFFDNEEPDGFDCIDHAALVLD